MATLRIDVRNGKFIGHNGVNIGVFKENYVEGNGWRCYITEDGEVVCTNRGTYQGKEHTLKYTLRNGVAKLTARIGKEEAKILKKHKLNQCDLDGTIGLSAGPANLRRAYFRDRDFQEFLDKYNLTAVNNTEPNTTFRLDEFNDSEGFLKQDIFTDGSIELEEEETLTIETDIVGTEFRASKKYKVTNATWAIVKSEGNKGISKVLYAIINPMKLTNLPENI